MAGEPDMAYVPNWQGRCEVCGGSPTVWLRQYKDIVLRTSLCGVCTWGSAALRDPDRWNEPEPDDKPVRKKKERHHVDRT
jgi:hypothetical protein